MDKNNSENKLSMNLNPCWNTPNIILKNGDVFAAEEINEQIYY